MYYRGKGKVMTASIQVWVMDTPGEICQHCDTTTDYLERNRIPFESRGLSEATPEQREEFRALGLSAPVVLTKEHGSWTGLRPDKLRQVKKAHQAEKAASPPSTSPAIHQLATTPGAAGASM